MKKEKVDRKTRFEIQLLINFNNNKFEGLFFIRNLSSNGFFIEISPLLNVGEIVSLTFTLPHNNFTVKTDGIVRWLRNRATGEIPMGAGIEFTNKDTVFREEIEKAIVFYKNLIGAEEDQ